MSQSVESAAFQAWWDKWGELTALTANGDLRRFAAIAFANGQSCGAIERPACEGTGREEDGRVSGPDPEPPIFCSVCRATDLLRAWDELKTAWNTELRQRISELERER